MQHKARAHMTIDKDVLQKLRQYAAEEQRPLSRYVSCVLRAHVDCREKQKGGGSSDVSAQG